MIGGLWSTDGELKDCGKVGWIGIARSRIRIRMSLYSDHQAAASSAAQQVGFGNVLYRPITNRI